MEGLKIREFARAGLGSTVIPAEKMVGFVAVVEERSISEGALVKDVGGFGGFSGLARLRARARQGAHWHVPHSLRAPPFLD
jgi:hypothetical protein